MKKENIDFLFIKLQEMYPDANTELKYGNAFQLLISVMLSAQSTDKQVNKITNILYKMVEGPKDILDMGLDRFTNLISSINYYKTKAKNIFETSKMLNQDPTIISPDIDVLQKLPGVGVKTAKVVSYVLFGSKVIAADTHVHRVSNRLGLVNTKMPEKTSELLEKKVPDKYKGVAHHGLILFGRYHCIARKPKCEICPFKDICKFYRASIKKGGRA
ncbi:MAG TPA: endonuclease III [Candidatus Absconditabacterales bacterium]|nr:endonuclease III [Candidatus Absconditabacterales bacterium]